MAIYPFLYDDYYLSGIVLGYRTVFDNNNKQATENITAAPPYRLNNDLIYRVVPESTTVS